MCEPERSRGPSLRAAVAAVGGAVAAGWMVRALSAAGGLAAAVVAVEGVLAAAGIVVLVRNLRAAPVKREAINHTVIHAALPAPRKAIEQPRPVVHVITGARERISR